MYIFIVFNFSLFLTIGLIPVIKHIALKMNIVDEPDERKVHKRPMPRSGGLAMALGAIVPVMLWVPIDASMRAVLMGCALIVVFGMLDDIRNLKYTYKLMAQIAGAMVIIFLGNIRIYYLGNLVPTDFILPLFFSIVLTLLFIVGVTNAINLSDGLDGLAGGISMLSFVSIGFMAYQAGNMNLAVMSAAVVGATLGFLRYNTYPAVVFMGDAGSQMLGFLCAVFTLMLTQWDTPYSQITPLFLIGFPILDTLTVMVERIANGVSPFKPDKNHFHHKLMKLGLYHSESVFVIYIFQALFIYFAFSLRFYSNGTNLVAFASLAGIIIFLFEVARKQQFRFRKTEDAHLISPSILVLIGGERLSIRFFFSGFKWLLLLLFCFQCSICDNVPEYISCVALAFIALIMISKKMLPDDINRGAVKLALYTTIPLLSYFSTIRACAWMTPRMEFINNVFFIVLIFFVISTLNLTKRRQGFKVNPLDFLIFIIIIIFPNIPSIHLHNAQLKLVMAKILILFFSYEVLLGELRKEDIFIEMNLIVAFVVIAIKGFL